jgi:hypothetical protein
MPDDPAPPPSRPAASAAPAAVLPEDGAPRRCSRCRSVFPGREERNAAGHVVWWLCPPCHESLLGGGVR